MEQKRHELDPTLASVVHLWNENDRIEQHIQNILFSYMELEIR